MQNLIKHRHSLASVRQWEGVIDDNSRHITHTPAQLTACSTCPKHYILIRLQCYSRGVVFHGFLDSKYNKHKPIIMLIIRWSHLNKQISCLQMITHETFHIITYFINKSLNCAFNHMQVREGTVFKTSSANTIIFSPIFFRILL